MACSLNASEALTRKARWEALAETALIDVRRTSQGARQVYRRDGSVTRELSELIALEAECCAFLDFELVEGEDELVLEVRGPREAGGIIDLFAGAGRPEG